MTYLRFEEGTAGNAQSNTNGFLDASGQGRHADGSGTGGASDGPTYRADTFGPSVPATGQSNGLSIELDGTDGVRFTDPGENFIFHDPNAEGTVELWLKFGNIGHTSIFWTRLDSTDTNRFNIYTQSVNGQMVLGGDYRSPSGTLHSIAPTSQIVVEQNTWTHVAITRTIANANEHVYRWYVNGSLVATYTDVNPDLPTANGFTIGDREGFRYQGFVDEFRMSDVALQPGGFLFDAAPPAVPESTTPGLIALSALVLAYTIRIQTPRRADRNVRRYSRVIVCSSTA